MNKALSLLSSMENYMVNTQEYNAQFAEAYQAFENKWLAEVGAGKIINQDKHNAGKTVIIVCGVNGAGKSTWINHVMMPQFQALNKPFIYVNADDWQQQQFGGFNNDTMEHARAAQQWANAERNRLLNEGKSFITETVFSHPTKLDFIQQARVHGFAVVLYHVHLVNAEIALARIRRRVQEGGHDVPVDKVRARYTRVLPIIAAATQYVIQAFVLDNSVEGQMHRLILAMEHGQIQYLDSSVPEWVQQGYAQPLKQYL